MYGKPVVASGSRDGAGVLLPGKTGLLLDDASPQGIAAALAPARATRSCAAAGRGRGRARARALRPRRERAQGRGGVRRAARRRRGPRAARAGARRHGLVPPRRLLILTPGELTGTARARRAVQAAHERGLQGSGAFRALRRVVAAQPAGERLPHTLRTPHDDDSTMCGICGVVALGEAGRGRDRRAHVGDARAPRPRRRRLVRGLRLRARLPPPRDHRPLRRGHAAVRERGRPPPARPQRRDLQLPRAARRARGDGPPLPQRDRHRGRRSPRTRRGATRCVERFNGMWAFAIWDERERRLFCARDRFGVKPFYYRFDDGRLVFASEAAAFRADDGVRLEPNRRAVREYLEQAYLDHTDETFFAGVRRLPPAHSLVLDERGLRVDRYWRSSRTTLRRATLRKRSASSSSTASASSSAATCRSGRASPAGSTRRRSRPRVDHLLRTEAENARAVGAAAADVHRVLRGSRASTSARTRARSSSRPTRSRTGSRSTPRI